METQPIDLTQTVQKGGCAAKVPATELRKILQLVRFPPAHADLLIDASTFDDAAVYRLADDLAIVQTLDFFTPIVDRARTFGAVAAANALSDVYAMGGVPMTAMGILAFPSQSFENSLIAELLQGASDKIAEAGACFVGGHSIDDDTLKFGLSVTGRVHPERIWSNAKARPGQKLILTKALGTGTLTAALKRREVNEGEIDEAVASMCLLNNIIDELPDDLCQQISAATDVTGFGLSGHSLQVARASRVALRFQVASLPVFARAFEFLERGFLTKAHRSNEAYSKDEISTSGLSDLQRLLLHDPQTSGGLLLSVEADGANEISKRLCRKFPRTAIVGAVESLHDAQVIFE